MPSIIPKLLLSSQRTDLQIYKNYALIYASLTKADLVGAAEVGNFSYKPILLYPKVVAVHIHIINNFFCGYTLYCSIFQRYYCLFS